MNFVLPGYLTFSSSPNLAFFGEGFHHQNMNDNASVANCLLGLMVVFSIVEITILVLFALNSWLPCYLRQTFWWDEDGEHTYDVLDQSSSGHDSMECHEDRRHRIKESLHEYVWGDQQDQPSSDDDSDNSRTSSSSSPPYYHHHHEQQQECSICLQNFEMNDIVVSSCIQNPSSCNHIFHKQCLQPWLSKHSTCPCCRQEMLIAPPSSTTKDASSSSLIGDEIDDESRISIVPWMTETGELPMSFRDYCLFFF